MFQKIKTPLIIIAILLVGFFAYNTFIKKSTDTNKDGLSVTPTAVGATPDKTILPLLLKIKDITFDSSVFDDPVFKILVDYGQKIIAEQGGRVNPFSPSFSVSSATSSIAGPTFGQNTPTVVPPAKK